MIKKNFPQLHQIYAQDKALIHFNIILQILSIRVLSKCVLFLLLQNWNTFLFSQRVWDTSQGSAPAGFSLRGYKQNLCRRNCGKQRFFYGKGTPFLCLLFFLSLNLYNNGNLPFAKAQKEKTLQFFITATFIL